MTLLVLLQDDLWHSIVLVQPGNAAGVGLLLVDGQPVSLAPLGMSAAHAAAPYWLDDFGGRQQACFELAAPLWQAGWHPSLKLSGWLQHATQSSAS